MKIMIYYSGFDLYEVILLLVFILIIILYKRIFGKSIFGKSISIPDNYLSENLPFDPDKQIPVIKCSICTGEQVAGFKDKEDGHFTEVMLIRGDKDLKRFKRLYNITEVKKEY